MYFTDTCTDAPYGVQIPDGSYSCNRLVQQLPEDQITGIYRNRKSICQMATTDCCASCETVAMETACEDESLGIDLNIGFYSCKYLTKQYPEDESLGIYQNGETICQDSRTKCCASCKIVAEEFNCQDDANGIHLGDGSYPCKYLTGRYEEDRLLGIYDNRVQICQDPMTQCCQTCKTVNQQVRTSNKCKMIL